MSQPSGIARVVAGAIDSAGRLIASLLGLPSNSTKESRRVRDEIRRDEKAPRP